MTSGSLEMLFELQDRLLAARLERDLEWSCITSVKLPKTNGL
jgi:hypothetical protein